MTVADKVNGNPCQARISSRDFLCRPGMVEPDLDQCYKVAKTEADKMGVDSLRPGGIDTHEYGSLLLREMRPTAPRRTLDLQQVDWTALLLRRTLQEAKVTTIMRYRIRNHTDLPTGEVRRLISFAGADLDWDRGVVYVDVRWTKPHRDRKNQYPASGHADWPVYTSLRIAKPNAYPLPWHDRGYVGLELGMIHDWQEALVAIAAHELKHLAEFQRGCMKRRQLMEARCDAYAFSRLMAHRERMAKLAQQQLDWMAEMEKTEQEVFPDAQPRAEVIVKVAS